MSLKSEVKRALYLSGYYSVLRKLGVAGGHRLLILMYHDLVDDETFRHDPFGKYKLTAEQFRAHVEEAERLFRVLSMEDAVVEIAAHGELKEPTVAITFDDGYRSFYDLAYPALKACGVTATVYLPTDWISGALRPWWLQLEQLFRELNDQSIPVSRLLSAPFVKEFSSSFSRPPRPEWFGFKEQVEAKLRGLPDAEIDEALRNFGEAAEVDLASLQIETGPMTWAQVTELSQQGIRFGAHTQSHGNLQYTSDEATREELAKSKEIIEQHVASEVTGFAYPYGTDEERYEQIKSLLGETGFSYACTARPGVNVCSRNPYMLRRTTLPHSTSKALLYRQLVLDYRQQPST